jgi:hypothetical protein
LIATYDFARRNGWQFRLAAIQPDYAMTSTTFNFDTDYMRGLFNLGFSTGRTGQQWQSSLQALAASPGSGRFSNSGPNERVEARVPAAAVISSGASE